jgi:Tfp pilus assembly protein FimV
VSRAGRRATVARYAAPVVFLLGVTIAVLLVRSGLNSDSGTTTGPVTHAATARVPPKTPTVTRARTSETATSVAGAVYYTVKSGDTFGSIASANGTTVEELQALNPGVSSNELQVGQQIRVK